MMTGKQRLQRLVDVLESGFKGVKFDMGVYIFAPGATEEMAGKPPPCRTAACAAGHAMLDPVLQAEGLRARYTDAFVDPVFADLNDSAALQHFFDLSPSAVVTLFQPSGGKHDRKSEVIKRIKKQIERM